MRGYKHVHMNLRIKGCEDTNNCAGARYIYLYIYTSTIYITVYMIYVSNDTMQSTSIFWCTIHQPLSVFSVKKRSEHHH